jgi:hypothetical protein
MTALLTTATVRCPPARACISPTHCALLACLACLALHYCTETGTLHCTISTARLVCARLVDNGPLHALGDGCGFRFDTLDRHGHGQAKRERGRLAAPCMSMLLQLPQLFHCHCTLHPGDVVHSRSRTHPHTCSLPHISTCAVTWPRRHRLSRPPTDCHPVRLSSTFVGLPAFPRT